MGRSGKNYTVPKYRTGRIFIFPLLLYLLLVYPVLGLMLLKSFPALKEKGRLELMKESNETSNSQKQKTESGLVLELKSNEPGDISVVTGDGDSTNIARIAPPPQHADRSTGASSMYKMFQLVFLFSVILGIIFNLPFKIYFYRKRRDKTIYKGLYKYCRRFLLKTPIINSGIVLLAFLVMHIIMIVRIQNPVGFEDELGRQIYFNYLFISLVASLLSVLFIYFWQKHLVHIKYIEYIYSKEELQKRIFGRNPGKIKSRLYIASAMTTLLPLIIVLLYLLLSLTPIKDMGEVSTAELRIMLGRLTDIMGPDVDLKDQFGSSNLQYISALDAVLMFGGILSGILVAFIYILFFVSWSTADIVRPVNELVKNMRMTSEGMLDNYTIVRTNDEIGVMSEGYNLMTSRLRDYIFKISQMNEAYSRFVPNQFLEFLGKENFVDIQLGDQVQKEMSVLFSDIRGFTELSEGLTPKENFDFINHYLGYMEPVIRKNNGFIDKFIGDSIMALFHESVDDAIDAAIEMRKALQQFNSDRSDVSLPSIDSGIGIHTGNLMLGVVGGEGRIDGTVISDAVNLASRLEGLTKIYKTSIIISEDTLIKLKNPGRYNFRFLDVARVKGKKEAVYIFEVLDGEPEEVKALKTETKALFGKGIEAYKNRNFKEAIEIFTEVARINPLDAAATFYINRCRNITGKQLPDDWSGIEVFDAK
ncbi:MAG TPA: adenylate/guanylate cyclase domain-containing protein [Lentimicrobium sp.]|nr:adenylate/guanylate cyclase domain-containing protein [Lentimicrobium sp.]